MNIVIASGKGGTGKTTLAVNFAEAVFSVDNNIKLLDCDVEEPNCHLFLDEKSCVETPVIVRRPVLEKSKCDGCGKCAEACEFNAIAVIKDSVLFFNEMCKSCGLCAYVCPKRAIGEQMCSLGILKSSVSDSGFPLVQGLLNIGEAMGIPVVKAVLKALHKNNINILDSAPGTGCPVVEVLDKGDVAVLVTEPTPFGLHDLKLAAALSLKMAVPTGIVINRSNNEDGLIEQFAQESGIPIIGRIPFKKEYAEAYSHGKRLVLEYPELKIQLLRLFEKIRCLSKTRPPSCFEVKLLHNKAAKPDKAEFSGSLSCGEITILSGKGGTGKTTVAASLSRLARDLVIVDSDVDAPDLHLLLRPMVKQESDFMGGKKAVVQASECTHCGLCPEVCRFDAIQSPGNPPHPDVSDFKIRESFCEGCGFCAHVCPSGAIEMKRRVAGKAFISKTNFGPMAHAQLGLGQENSGKLVSLVKQNARKISTQENKGLIIGDGPPGTGCPVIASLGNSKWVLAVTEPTVSGVHDLERILTLTRHFAITSYVVINKSDLNPEQSEKIHQLGKEMKAEVLGNIPFDEKVHEALMMGKLLVDHGGPASEALKKIWTNLEGRIRMRTTPQQ